MIFFYHFTMELFLNRNHYCIMCYYKHFIMFSFIDLLMIFKYISFFNYYYYYYYFYYYYYYCHTTVTKLKITIAQYEH